jgi:cell division protein FtsI/penicillin-binding protein 2
MTLPWYKRDNPFSRPQKETAVRQNRYRRRPSAPPGRPRHGRRLSIGLLVVLAAALGWFFVGGREAVTGDHPALPAGPPAAEGNRMIAKSDVHVLLGDCPITDLAAQPAAVDFDGRVYNVSVSLDPELQRYLLKRMDRRNSRYIGIVAMNAKTGRLLAMAGYNRIDPDQNPCLMADHPAASLFKIVTAAAAVEENGYTAGTRFKFNGFKHTLYKRQLTDKTNRYTNAISLKDSFAQSVNPVFGKIGALYLDKQALATFGDAFVFNRAVEFELPWPTSHLAVEDDAYHRAEIASGFNRQTTLSPLHGAVIVSAVVNDGVPVEPTLVDRIVDQTGSPIYRSEPRYLAPAMSPQTADVLEQLMVATVTAGTARKTFRGFSRNKVLSHLNLGGKTGSIYNRAHDARYDWYVGFATEKNGTEKLVVSVVVAHEKYIGIRAGEYARMTIEHYFKDYFAREKQAQPESSG